MSPTVSTPSICDATRVAVSGALTLAAGITAHVSFRLGRIAMLVLPEPESPWPSDEHGRDDHGRWVSPL